MKVMWVPVTAESSDTKTYWCVKVSRVLSGREVETNELHLKNKVGLLKSARYR